MTALLDTPAGPLALAVPGIVDTFRRQELDDGWQSLSTVYPAYFCDPLIEDATLRIDQSQQEPNSFEPPRSWLMVGSYVIWRSIGATDNQRVRVGWTVPDIQGTIHQVSPITHVDPDDPDDIALCPVWDVSLSAMGIQSVYLFEDSTPPIFIDNTFDPTPAKLLGPDGNMHTVRSDDGDYIRAGSVAAHALPTTGSHTMDAVCIDGTITQYFDDQRQVGPFNVPEPYAGRDGWGVRVVDIWPVIGHDVTDEWVVDGFGNMTLNAGWTGEVDHITPSIVDRVNILPIGAN